ncbi:MAG: trehalose utilization protein ThuA, partial [Chloroflexota bacterium]|nr:trehalose utilization protein ThuA [Chloroflexota bacterium]
TYYNPEVQRVIANGVRWAAPTQSAERVFGNFKALEGAAG